jgi:SAM-dependent methyltransferase
MQQSEYADKWAVSSEKYHDDGIYSWFEGFVNDSQNVLEIGCGVGYSTLTLLQAGHKVIAIEKNLFCIEKTRELLEKHKYQVSIATTSEELHQCPNNFDAILVYRDIRDLCESDLVDLAEDFNLIEINAVLIWLLGYHSYTGEDINQARIDVENKVFFLAKNINPQNFMCVHYVDRATENSLQEKYNKYRGIADDFNEFSVSELVTYKYDYDVLGGEPMVYEGSDNSPQLFMSLKYTFTD